MNTRSQSRNKNVEKTVPAPVTRSQLKAKCTGQKCTAKVYSVETSSTRSGLVYKMN